MPKDFKYFTAVQHLNDDEIANFIDTAVTRAEDFKPVMQQIRRLGDPKKPLRILDFGCGIGRNIVGMLEYSPKWLITGYDNPNMLARGLEFYGERLRVDRVHLIDDWDKIAAAVQTHLPEKKPFDIIFCSLVLQHIDVAQLRDYLTDFCELTNRLFVSGRRALDEGWTNSSFVSVWDIIQEKFDAVECEAGLQDVEFSEGLQVSGSPDDHHYGIFAPRKDLL